jgi:hypothetical protein
MESSITFTRVDRIFIKLSNAFWKNTGSGWENFLRNQPGVSKVVTIKDVVRLKYQIFFDTEEYKTLFLLKWT